MTFCIIGDSGCDLRSYLSAPLVNLATRAENIYKRCFGVWKSKFLALAYGFIVKLESVWHINSAIAVLYNKSKNMGEKNPLSPADFNEELNYSSFS